MAKGRKENLGGSLFARAKTPEIENRDSKKERYTKKRDWQALIRE